MARLVLYDYPASANCYKVRLLLAQLGLDYERVKVDIFAGDTLTPEYGEKNLGLTTPVLEIEPGVYLPESAAILLYLAEGTDLLPADPVERARVHRWLFFEQANVVPYIGGLRFRVITDRLPPDGSGAEQMTAIAGSIVAVLNRHLEGREFMECDAYTVADIAIYGYLHVAHEAGLEMEPHSNVNAWLERVRSQPGHVDNLEPYPPNSRRGASRSIYDLVGM